jgi:hypothetical protein
MMGVDLGLRDLTRSGRAALWRKLDRNSGGTLGYGEIEEGFRTLYPALDQLVKAHPPSMRILMMAYKAAAGTDGLVSRGEFHLLCDHIDFFSSLWDSFDLVSATLCGRGLRVAPADTSLVLRLQVDRSGNGRLDHAEFADGFTAIEPGCSLAPEEIVQEFQQVDSDGTGSILFEEFAMLMAARRSWAARVCLATWLNRALAHFSAALPAFYYV